jgi:DNA (cytosine-5)-methyltransferase 1
VLVENVSALLARGMGRVLADLAESGYDAEWDCIPASAIGAPHRRDRIFIVAYPSGEGRRGILRSYFTSLAKTPCFWPSESLDTSFDTLAWIEKRMGESSIFGSDDGLPSRVDRLKSCGNSVVPQQVYPILKAIMDYEASSIFVAASRRALSLTERVSIQK